MANRVSIVFKVIGSRQVQEIIGPYDKHAIIKRCIKIVDRVCDEFGEEQADVLLDFMASNMRAAILGNDLQVEMVVKAARDLFDLIANELDPPAPVELVVENPVVDSATDAKKTSDTSSVTESYNVTDETMELLKTIPVGLLKISDELKQLLTLEGCIVAADVLKFDQEKNLESIKDVGPKKRIAILNAVVQSAQSA